MKTLIPLILFVILCGSTIPTFALDTPQTCNTNKPPVLWPGTHIYVTDTNNILPYIPLTDHVAIFHDDDVWNTNIYPRTVDVTLTIQDQYTGKQIFNQTQSLQMQACSGPESVKWRFVPIQVDYYNATVSDDRGKVGMNLNSILDTTRSQTVSLPLEQSRFGIDSHNVICRPGLDLVIKSEDSSPACVKPVTVNKLTQRGWGIMTGSTTQASIAQNTSNNKNSTNTGPPCVSNATHQYASAGVMGLPLCPVVNFSASSKILNASGFYGIYNYTVYTGVQNYVLEPGHNGTLKYLISVNSINNWGQTSEYPNDINITNNLEFMHDAGMQDHPGIHVSVYPKSETIEKGGSVILTITISVSQNAPIGTYWIRLPPGVCAGGENIILTVTDCSGK